TNVAPVLGSLTIPSLGTLIATANDPSTTPQVYAQAGVSVAFDGSYTLVGAPGATLEGIVQSGAAYVYDTVTGTLMRTLAAPSPLGDDYFGTAVAVAGSIAVVGAPYDGASNNAGLVYVFDLSTGKLLQTLKSPKPAAHDRFGNSVAISSGLIVVGGIDIGATFVFDALTGNLVRTLNDPDPASGGNFGSSVKISQRKVLVGALGRAAYLFDADTGNLLKTLADPTGN